MLKLSMLAGVAVAAIGFASMTSGSAFAAGCLNTTLPPITLSHNAMVPNAGYEYDKSAYDAEAAKGNHCATTQQSYRSDNAGGVNNPDEPQPNAGLATPAL